MSVLAALLLAAAGSASLSVTASGVSGSRLGAGTASTSDSPNTTVVGGVAPYTYAWTYVSGSTVPQPNSPGIANPVWSGELGAADSQEAIWRITVTDSGGSPPASFDIPVSLFSL